MGFRRGRGAQDQCTLLAHDINIALKNKEHVLSIMFDVEKAFDACWIEGIMYKISKRRELPPRFAKLIKSYLTTRTIQTITNGTKSETCLLYTSPSPRDGATSRMPSSA